MGMLFTSLDTKSGGKESILLYLHKNSKPFYPYLCVWGDAGWG